MNVVDIEWPWASFQHRWALKTTWSFCLFTYFFYYYFYVPLRWGWYIVFGAVPPPQMREDGGHIFFGADPIGIGVGVTLSCLLNIRWTSGWRILTKFAWIYSWDITKNWSDFGDVDLKFKVTAVEKLKILWHFLVCTISFEPVVGFLTNFH